MNTINNNKNNNNTQLNLCTTFNKPISFNLYNSFCFIHSLAHLLAPNWWTPKIPVNAWWRIVFCQFCAQQILIQARKLFCACVSTCLNCFYHVLFNVDLVECVCIPRITTTVVTTQFRTKFDVKHFDTINVLSNVPYRKLIPWKMSRNANN